MVDLIPAEYRHALRIQRLLQGLGWACLSLVLVLGLCAAGVAHLLREERVALARFKHLQAQASAQQARLTATRARRDLAERQVQALDALRGGASIGRLFDAVDATLNGRIWFQELVYSRAGETAGQKSETRGPAAVAATGTRAEAKGGDSARRARERAEIRGVAIDHPALAEFIRELSTQPGMIEVRLLDTSARNYPNLQVVDFQLAALLDVPAVAAPAGVRAPVALPLAAVGIPR